ncbi:uncharacterized protein TRIVIDRAFT_51487 [Trichoderma virens Gv29-8]|uniref:Uncharacterized protein n=1 Tax=Hypocrea virens (strain Gv29-8 / FGSC 10586) TaxID=413071 RepID=G9NDQ9_HYPVG|nr:uncharacterized protein TRIVIDRAFT_51487 [Trichoderma virens Gv29-8]EHK15160.1 hypothetical protein TRIVIDRAFT_51487 [Trichoderma virens Gv29-8]
MILSLASLGLAITPFKYPYLACGGRGPNPHKCPASWTCKDDLRTPDNCGLKCGRPGICVPNNAPSCGGITGKRCPAFFTCYDTPNDGCDPTKGGADCLGICL